jgi:hypothetical protein
MRRRDGIADPTTTFLVWVLMLVVGAWLGFLCGIGVISYEALVGFFLASLAVFVVWAVWNLDPAELDEDEDSASP